MTAREAAAKMALLEARVAETSMQRTQLEDLIQSLARSRDENVLADVEAAIRVALQQSAITGSAEPLVLTLKQADERLARYNQPRLERVRRAVAQDLERTRTAGVTDITVLTIRLDDVIRQVDDLPLLAAAERRAARAAPDGAGGHRRRPPLRRCRLRGAAWLERLARAGRDFVDHLWREVRSLVRVTRIDQPEAMLVAPEQAFFLRENLKLRLLNARLALLSRQFDTAQSDLRDAQSALDRYFDRSSRRVVAAGETVRQVIGAVAAGQRAAARRHAGGHRRGVGRPLSRRRGRTHAQRHLARAAVRGGGGGRHDAGHQRRPGDASTGAAGAPTSRSTCSSSLVAAACFVLVLAAQALRSLVSLPRRAGEWRALRRERAAQAALREALAEYFGARYGRARKAAQRALAVAEGHAGAGRRRRLPRARRTARRRQPAPPAGPHAAATRRCSARCRPRRSRAAARASPTKPRGCWPPNGRWTTATRRARWTCWPSCRPAPRAARRRCG